jgi:NAD(P)-dependent dehydrogenase (short-subunit alcohol dehydrogenase family)
MSGRTNLIALVTGASSGIGEAAARLLADAGMQVFGAARRRLAPELHRITPLTMDLSDPDSIESSFQSVAEAHGGIDVLVNAAGYGSYGAVEEVPIEEARRQFEVNLFGLARLTQLALPAMRVNGDARIINVSSIGGKIYEPLGAWYHASKFALEGFSDSLRLELRPFGIAVSVIEPGAIATEWSAHAGEALSARSGGGPYSRQAETMSAVLRSTEVPGASSPPEEVAKVIRRAAVARRPKPRYVVGRHARPALAARRLLPDRAFDWVLLRGFQRMSRASGPG